MRKNRTPKIVVHQWRYDGYIARSYTCLRKDGPLMLTIHQKVKVENANP